jgi:fumarate hydratase subunit beta
VKPGALRGSPERVTNMAKIVLTPPLDAKSLAIMHAGDRVLITGVIYTGRDAAHKRMFELLKEGKPLPIDLQGQIIYYVGPTPARPGKVAGSAGPTTSGRMDAYAPLLIEHGLKGMIGKGSRSQEVIEAMVKHKAVYLAAVGGAGALISKTITSSKVIAWEELGPEAIRAMEVQEFPAVVINDIYGNDLYKQGREKYARL